VAHEVLVASISLLSWVLGENPDHDLIAEEFAALKARG
jgi:hypothetical protein